MIPLKKYDDHRLLFKNLDKIPRERWLEPAKMGKRRGDIVTYLTTNRKWFKVKREIN